MTLTLALQGGAGAIVLAVVLMIFHGDLFTRSMVDRIVKGFEQRDSDKDEQIRLWRDAYYTVKKTNDALITSMYQSLEIGKTTIGVVGAIPSTPAPAPGGQGDPSVVA